MTRALLVLLLAALPTAAPTQYVVAVFDPVCITEVHKTEHTRLEAPVGKDGRPDMSKAQLLGVGATYNTACMRLEIRRAP